MNILHTFLKRFRRGAYQNPTRDWIVLLTFAVLAFGCIVVWNAWAFDTVANGGTLSAPTTSVPQAFNKTSLDTINAVFSSRASEQAKYVSGGYRFADPSQ